MRIEENLEPGVEGSEVDRMVKSVLCLQTLAKLVLCRRMLQFEMGLVSFSSGKCISHDVMVKSKGCRI